MLSAFKYYNDNYIIAGAHTSVPVSLPGPVLVQRQSVYFAHERLCTQHGL
jgi:hypothetical protein